MELELMTTDDIAKFLPEILSTAFPKEEVYAIPTQPLYSGVYFLLNDDDVVYVGKATWIRERMRGHVSTAKMEFNRIAYITCKYWNGLEIEKKFIKHILPKYNKYVPR